MEGETMPCALGTKFSKCDERYVADPDQLVRFGTIAHRVLCWTDHPRKHTFLP